MRGSTLAVALILSGVLLSIGISLFNVFIAESRVNHLVENNVTAGMVMSALRLVLFDPPLCSMAISGESSVPGTEIAINNISINGTTGTLKKATTIFPGVKVLSVQLLTPFNDLCAVNTPACSPTVYSAAACPNKVSPCKTAPIVDQIYNLVVKITMTQQLMSGAIRPLSFPLTLTINSATKKILGCQSMGMYPIPGTITVSYYSRFKLCRDTMGGKWVGKTWNLATNTWAGVCQFPTHAASIPPALP